MTSAGGQELQPSDVNNSSTTGRVSAPTAATNPTDKVEAISTERNLCPMLSRPAMKGLNDIAVWMLTAPRLPHDSHAPTGAQRAEYPERTGCPVHDLHLSDASADSAGRSRQLSDL